MTVHSSKLSSWGCLALALALACTKSPKPPAQEQENVGEEQRGEVTSNEVSPPTDAGASATSSDAPQSPPAAMLPTSAELIPLSNRSALQEVALPEATFPLTLAELATPLPRTAHLRVHFSVLDADGRTLSDLRTSDFRVLENNVALDSAESALRIERAPETLQVPIVLLIDLSRSVFETGALPRIRAAVDSVIESLASRQLLKILVFADEVRALTSFTNDRVVLHRAIDDIETQEGNSTNLFGALVEGYQQWENGIAGFTPPDAGVEQFAPINDTAEGELVVGLLIAVSDGNDSAGVATLPQALEARGNKQTIFVRMGADLDLNVARQVGNTSVLDATGSLDLLSEGIRGSMLRASQLNEALYVVEYCSPKRAASHTLLLELTANTEFLKDNPQDVCQSSTNAEACTEESISCGGPSGAAICCPLAFPFACPEQAACRETAASAASVCGSRCVVCGRATPPFEESDGEVEFGFDADGFASAQCNALFDRVDSSPLDPPRAPPAPADAGAPDAG